jgi:hypothetical protein
MMNLAKIPVYVCAGTEFVYVRLELQRQSCIITFQVYLLYRNDFLYVCLYTMNKNWMQVYSGTTVLCNQIEL